MTKLKKKNTYDTVPLKPFTWQPELWSYLEKNKHSGGFSFQKKSYPCNKLKATIYTRVSCILCKAVQQTDRKSKIQLVLHLSSGMGLHLPGGKPPYLIHTVSV